MSKHSSLDPRGDFEFFQSILANSDDEILRWLADEDMLDELSDTGSVTVELAGRKWEITLNVKEVK